MHTITQSQPSTARIEAFTDGVLAIVITLMVLEIKIPAMAEQIGNADAWLLLGTLWPKLASYAISFFMIAIFWVNHHGLFHAIKHSTKSLLWLNNLWLFIICLLPFPTAFLGEHPALPLACALFGTELFLCALFFFAIRWHAYQSGLFHEENSKALVRKLLMKSALAPLCYAISIVVSWLSIQAAYCIFIGLPVVFIFSFTKKTKS